MAGYADAAEQRGVDLPAELTEGEPEKEPGDDYFLDAFWQLSTTRQFGFGHGPIPVFHIWHFCDRQGFDPELAEMFIQIIREMDAGYLQFYADKAKADAAAKT